MSTFTIDTSTSRATPSPVPGKRMTVPSIRSRKADGKRLPGPRATASMNAAYLFRLPGAPGTFTAFAEYSWRGAGFVTPLNEARLEIPGRSLTNARLSWTVQRWTASAFVENLFNTTYVDTYANVSVCIVLAGSTNDNY